MGRVTEQKKQSDKTTSELRKALEQDQQSSPCAGVLVPDAVNQQLRDRASAINAASAGAG